MDLDFGQISEMLGSMSEDEMQNLQDAAQELFSQLGGPEPPTDEDAYGSRFDEGSGGGSSGGMGFNPALLAMLSQLMQRMNSRDARTDLILALKPHLSRRRQHRAEQAVQMLKMLDLLPTLQEAFK